MKTTNPNDAKYPHIVTAQMRALVKAGKVMRSTPIVDDDFSEMLHRFDVELRLAEQMLKELDHEAAN